MEDVVIVSAVRTPIGAFGGGLSSMSAVELGSIVIEEALERAQVDPAEVDEVLMGNILAAGLGMNPARQAAIKAGLPVTVPAMTVNKMCGSGLKTVALAAQAIKLGDADVMVAGGMESMSGAPYLLPQARFGHRMGHGEVVDSMLNDGLWCHLADCHMGITAENLADMYEISRDEMDEFAARSQHRAARAMDGGVFVPEIAPVSVPQARGEPKLVDTDEHPRPDVTAERLGRLSPAFKKEGTVTPGNASGINDGASAVVVMSGSRASQLGLTPLGVVRSYASAGVEPHIMGIAPVASSNKALGKAGLSVDDMDLVELNEAFAAQSLAVGKVLGLDWERTNVNGGAIALGHPLAASGTRILTTLLYEMGRREADHGMATLCIGGGQGISLIIDRS